jgi:hypothetical protein
MFFFHHHFFVHRVTGQSLQPDHFDKAFEEARHAGRANPWHCCCGAQRLSVQETRQGRVSENGNIPKWH